MYIEISEMCLKIISPLLKKNYIAIHIDIELLSSPNLELFSLIKWSKIRQTFVLYSNNASHLILTSCLLNCCIKSISHLQTPLIIFKSCNSVYRDLWAHRKRSIRERVLFHFK